MTELLGIATAFAIGFVFGMWWQTRRVLKASGLWPLPPTVQQQKRAAE